MMNQKIQTRAKGIEVLLLFVGLYLVNQRLLLNDDAFVYFRYIENLFAGNGLVYNAGEYIEGFTSPLWLAYVCFLRLFTHDYYLIVYLNSHLCALLTWCLVSYFHRKVTRQNANTALYSPYVLAMVIGIAPLTVFFSSGMETSFMILYAVIFSGCLLTRVQNSALWATLLGVGPLLRPEFSILSGLGICYLFTQKRIKQAMVALVAIALTLTILEMFRVSYYGSLLPNPGYVKSGLQADYYRGWDYYLRMTIYGLPWFFSLSLFISLTAKIDQKTERLWLCVCAIAMTIFALRVSDYHHGRMVMVPLILVFFSLCGTLEEILPKLSPTKSVYAIYLLPVVLFLFCHIHQPYTHDYSARNFRWGYRKNWISYPSSISWQTLEQFVERYTRLHFSQYLLFDKIADRLKLKRKLWVITNPIAEEYHGTLNVGFVGYYGLTDPVISRLATRSDFPGHDKTFLHVLPYLFLRKIDFMDSQMIDRSRYSWLSRFSIPINFDTQPRQRTRELTLLHFDSEVIENLSRISTVSGLEMANRTNQLAEEIIQKVNPLEEHLDAAYFLLHKARNQLSHENSNRLSNWYQQQDQKSSIERYLNRERRKLLLLMRGSHQPRGFVRGLQLALKTHNLQIQPFHSWPIVDYKPETLRAIYLSERRRFSIQ